MKNEAQANAESDKAARERVDKLNAADTLIFQTEKQINEYGDKLPDDKKATIQTALDELKEAHKSEDMDAIEAKSEALTQAWQAASEDIYKASQEAGGNPEGPSASAGGEEASQDGKDVTDVEYEEVEDKG